MLLLFLLLKIIVVFAFPTKIVNTTSGPVRGSLEDGVRSFLSIPYAKPPVGELRFKDPEPPSPWSEVLNCTQQAESCPQLHVYKEIYSGNEDCLYLDVHAPRENKTTNLLPVMFWIYGGGWVQGDEFNFGIYNVKHLIEMHDIIIVSVNYRLGPFGFMALEELAAESPIKSTGNYGLLDQVLGLKWVRDNIEAFGGDKNRITIMGESAGAISVCWHLASPLSTGLFSGAIMESGTCDSPWFFRSYSNSQSFSRLYASVHGCNNTSGQDLLKCLRTVETGDFMAMKNISGVPGFHPKFYPVFSWAAAIDGTALPDLPISIIRKGKFNNVPLLIGTNHDEGTILVPVFPILVRDFHFPIDAESYDLALMHFFDDDKLTVNKIKKAYPNASHDYWTACSEFTRDYLFTCATRRLVKSITQTTQSVWRYEFTYDKGWFYNLTIGDFHASELLMVFDNYIILHPSHDDDQMAKTFHLYWTNMIKYGSPNIPSGIIPPEKPDIILNWPSWNTSSRENIVLNIPPSINDHLYDEVCDMWDTIPWH